MFHNFDSDANEYRSGLEHLHPLHGALILVGIVGAVLVVVVVTVAKDHLPDEATVLLLLVAAENTLLARTTVTIDEGIAMTEEIEIETTTIAAVLEAQRIVIVKETEKVERIVIVVTKKEMQRQMVTNEKVQSKTNSTLI